MKDIVIDPQEILALYASPAQMEKGEKHVFYLENRSRGWCD